jgi:Protein of unknown function (DUF1189)
VRRYTILHPLFMSFYSRSLYRDVARNWRGLCVLYLVSLVALCAIPGVMQIRTELSAFLAKEAPMYVKQVPAITISKGKVALDVPEPYLIRDENTGTVRAIIDTTGKINTLSGSKAVLLLTKTTLFVRGNEGETRAFDLSEIDHLFIDRSTVYSFLDTLDDWFAVFVYPLAVVVSFLFRGLEVIILALIGLLFTHALRATLDYRALIRLAAMAITPVVVSGGILALADISIHYWPLLGVVISIGYILFAVRVNSDVSA